MIQLTIASVVLLATLAAGQLQQLHPNSAISFANVQLRNSNGPYGGSIGNVDAQQQRRVLEQQQQHEQLTVQQQLVDQQQQLQQQQQRNQQSLLRNSVWPNNVQRQPIETISHTQQTETHGPQQSSSTYLTTAQAQYQRNLVLNQQQQRLQQQLPLNWA